MTWATSVCLIPGIIQSGAGETSSTGIHRDLSQGANAVQSKSRRRAGGRKEKSHENNRAEKEEMVLLVKSLSLKPKEPSGSLCK